MPLASRQNELMSLEQWCALGEDTSTRSELQEGVLIVSPRPRLIHQKVLTKLGAGLLVQAPPGFTAVTEPDVVIDSRTPATVRVPDVVVIRENDDESMLTAADVLLAVEILSPGTRRVDLVLKRFEYAEAGIANYWIVDFEGTPRLEALTLVDGSYVGDWVTGTHTSNAPFPLTIDLDAFA
ncbi:Uma2 family endonuclease [Gordonia spumicola]|nr:Uma2 family endonuclease [Gordonia spumicola]